MNRHGSTSVFVGAALAAILAFPVGPAVTAAHAAEGSPARIQDGTCDALGGVAFPLTGVGATVTGEGEPLPEREVVGSADALPIALSETTLDASISDLTEAEYAIVVYESDEAMDRVIACGNVAGLLKAQMAGMIMPGDELLVWLGAEKGSGAVGLATLRSVVGGELAVTIVLSE